MKEKIAVISDNSLGIEYKKYMTFIEADIFKTDDKFEEESYSCYIVESSNREKKIEIIKKIRGISKEAGIIIMGSDRNPFDIELQKSSEGYGPLRVLNWNHDYPEKIMEEVNTILHPEYPAGKSDIAIILPVYNEESRFENVVNFVAKLNKFIEKGFLNTRIYFVNDGSLDHTDRLVKSVVEKNKSDTGFIYDRAFLSAKELIKNTRKAGTYIEGIKTIEADIMVFVDADDSFEVEDIALMINILREGYYEMVVGTKDMTAEKRPPIRKIMSFGKRTLTRWMLSKGVYDSQTGLKAMKSYAAKFLLPYLNPKRGLAIDLELLYFAKELNFRVLQLPVKCIDREGSHVDVVKDSINFLKSIWAIRAEAGKKLRIQKNKRL